MPLNVSFFPLCLKERVPLFLIKVNSSTCALEFSCPSPPNTSHYYFSSSPLGIFISVFNIINSHHEKQNLPSDPSLLQVLPAVSFSSKTEFLRVFSALVFYDFFLSTHTPVYAAWHSSLCSTEIILINITPGFHSATASGPLLDAYATLESICPC